MVGKRLIMDSNLELTVPHFSDLIIDADNLEEDALRLVGKLRPHWDLSTLKIKQFTEGITNRLVGCFPQDFDPGKGDEDDDVILIRVYGQNTETFIDRRKEISNMVLIYQNGLSPPVFCSFSNGMAYGYSSGSIVDGNMVRDEFIYNLIALQMVKMHSIVVHNRSNCSRVSIENDDDDNNKNHDSNNNRDHRRSDACLFQLLRRYLHLISISLSPNDPVDNFLTAEKLTFNDLYKEVDQLEDHLESIGSPLVFCHNDLLLNNIIYNESQSSIHFIDFEYADVNYQAFDIANHFNEFSGVDEYDPEMYPAKEFQLKWLSCYLNHWDRIMGNRDQSGDGDSVQDFDLRVEHLYFQVTKFSLASNLCWGVWALLQALNSTIDFAFIDSYGGPRLREYFKKKESILSLSSPIKKTVS